MLKVLQIGTGIHARELKETLALKDDDIRFIFAATLPPPTPNSQYLPPTVKHLDFPLTDQYRFTEEDIQRTVDLCKAEQIDVIHTHNYPDTYGLLALEVRKRTGIPFIHEIHDTAYENTPDWQTDMEKVVYAEVDAMICVSEEMKSLILEKYPNYGLAKKISVIYSYPSKHLLPPVVPDMPRSFKRCIYQGGIIPEVVHGQCDHRFYGDIFKSLISQGISLDIYPTKDFGFRMAGTNIMPTLPVKELYAKISGYDFGFVGYYRSSSQVMDIAMPNKLFEYVACGIPVVAMNYRGLKKFVEDNGVGIVVDDNINLPTDFDSRMAEAKKRCIAMRERFTMEHQKDILIEIYRRIAKC